MTRLRVRGPPPPDYPLYGPATPSPTLALRNPAPFWREGQAPAPNRTPPRTDPTSRVKRHIPRPPPPPPSPPPPQFSRGGAGGTARTRPRPALSVVLGVGLSVGVGLGVGFGVSRPQPRVRDDLGADRAAVRGRPPARHHSRVTGPRHPPSLGRWGARPVAVRASGLAGGRSGPVPVSCVLKGPRPRRAWDYWTPDFSFFLAPKVDFRIAPVIRSSFHLWWTVPRLHGPRVRTRSLWDRRIVGAGTETGQTRPLCRIEDL